MGMAGRSLGCLISTYLPVSGGAVYRLEAWLILKSGCDILKGYRHPEDCLKGAAGSE